MKSKAGGTGAPVAKKPKQKSKLYAMPEKIAEGTILTDLSRTQWRIGPSIGTGGFGEIYSAYKVGEKNYDSVVKCVSVRRLCLSQLRNFEIAGAAWQWTAFCGNAFLYAQCQAG